MQEAKNFSRFEWLQQQVGKSMNGSPSPFAQWLNGTLLSVAETGLRASFQVRKDMTNPAGMLHGGVIAGIFDDLMGTTFFGMDTEYFYPTVDLSVQYFAPAYCNEIVEAETKVIKKGQTIIHMEAFLYNKDSKILAKASTNIVKSSIKL